MRIGFFGGSFDPPHRGHLAIAQAAAERCGLSRVLLTPTANQPLKPDGQHAPYADRLEMVRLLCAENPRLEASDADAPRPDAGPNYTIDTLRTLQPALHPADALVVIVGIDAFLQITRWRRPQELLRDFDWAVVSRPGCSLADINAMGLTSAQLARIRFIDDLAEAASATAIRTSLQQDNPTQPMLTPAVLAYIRAHHLYAASPPPAPPPIAM